MNDRKYVDVRLYLTEYEPEEDGYVPLSWEGDYEVLANTITNEGSRIGLSESIAQSDMAQEKAMILMIDVWEREAGYVGKA